MSAIHGHPPFYRPFRPPSGLGAGVRAGVIIAAAGELLRKGANWTTDQVRVANLRLDWRLTEAELERAKEIAVAWRDIAWQEAALREADPGRPEGAQR